MPDIKSERARHRSDPVRRPLDVPANIAAILAPVVLVGGFVALGANSSLLGTLAGLAAFLTAALTFALLPPDVGFWRAIVPVLGPFVLALGWAALPLALPEEVARGSWIMPGEFLASFVTLAGVLVWLATGAAMGARPQITKRTIDIFIALCIPWILVSIIAFRVDPAHVWGIDKGLPRPRFSATILNPNTAACAMAMIGVLAGSRFLLAAHYVIETVGTAQRRAVIALATSWLTTMLALVAMSLTSSRLATILGGGGIVLLTLQARRLARHSHLYYISCIAALLLPMLIGSAIGGVRVIQKMAGAEGDLALRWEDFTHYWRLSLEAPWFGHGLGSFRALNLATLDQAHVLHRWNFGAAHDVILHSALEGGWPFALLSSAGVGFAVVLILRARATLAFDTSMYGLVFAVIIALVCGLGDIALNVPALAALAAWLGGLMLGRTFRGASGNGKLSPGRARKPQRDADECGCAVQRGDHRCAVRLTDAAIPYALGHHSPPCCGIERIPVTACIGDPP